MTALPPEGNAFDLAFEPLIEIKGPVTEKVSTFDVLMRRRYREALEGKVDAIKVMLNVIRHDARFRAEANGPHRTRIVREGASGIVPATPAMRLLDIARPMGLAGRIGIAPWVAALVRQRLGDRAVDACREYLCDPVSSEGSCSEDGAKPVERYSLHDDPDYYIPPKASAPQATWFPKGKSGNPAGRPPRRDIDVPFGGFLQGMVAIKIEGQERTVTRLEALVYQLQVKALNGDASVSRLLVEAGVAEHLDRWRRRPEVMRIVYEGSRGLGEDPFVLPAGPAPAQSPHPQACAARTVDRHGRAGPSRSRCPERGRAGGRRPLDQHAAQGQLARMVVPCPAQTPAG